MDDDAAFGSSTAFLLDSVGYKSRLYLSAADFLAAFPTGHGCIILDVAMPGLSGLDLQAVLVERQLQMPIVFLTGHGDLRSGVRAMRGGAEDFLTKPVDADELLDAVRRALDRDEVQTKARNDLSELRQRLARLSEREAEILRHIANGRLNKQVAADLGLALQTVKFHRGNIMSKLEARSLLDLVRIAERTGLIKVWQSI
ncbi:MAG: response regulator transcription factor [Paracoccaceae bacterium]